MLEGKLVNLRVQEKEDLPMVSEWFNNPEFLGEYEPLGQSSRTALEKEYDKLTSDQKWFIIEKKDGSKIGFIGHFIVGSSAAPLKLVSIGYALTPNERNKGYCTEAVKILVDYLFLSQDIVRIQALIDVGNIASQRIVEKNGFRKEGIVRKSFFARGKWSDMLLYSILRDGWKEPKILTKTVPKK